MWARTGRVTALAPSSTSRGAWLGLHRTAPPDTVTTVEEMNGWPALVIRVGGRIAGVVSLETDGEQVFAIGSVVNPDKLARL